jgi:hypothetical protein
VTVDIAATLQLLYQLLSAYFVAVYDAIVGVATAPTVGELLSRTLGLLLLLLPAFLVYAVSQVAKYLLIALGVMVTGLVAVRLALLALGL